MDIIGFIKYVLRIIVYFRRYDFFKGWIELKKEFIKWYGYSLVVFVYL